MLAGDFFFVVVGDRRALVNPTEAIDSAGIEEQRGEQLRLPGAAMADQRDVPQALGVINLHGTSLPKLSAFSCQPSAFRFIGDQSSDEPGQHPFDFDDPGVERPVGCLGKEPEVPGKKQMILKFAGGAQGEPKEAPEIAIPSPTAAFGDICRHRRRGPDQMVTEGTSRFLSADVADFAYTASVNW